MGLPYAISEKCLAKWDSSDPRPHEGGQVRNLACDGGRGEPLRDEEK